VSAEGETAEQLSQGVVKDVVVVGAGPAGAAAAMLLCKDGYNVQVFERRDTPANDANARAFGIVINERGRHALSQLGITLPAPECGVKFEGSLRHTVKGTSLMPNSEGSVCVDRGALARYMVNYAQENYPAIKFNFNKSCTAIDTVQRKACFKDIAGEEVCAEYDLLVGADGANSAVREALMKEGRITYTREENQRDYKSFVLDKKLWDQDPEYKNKMLTWSSVDGSVTRMWAVPNPDGTAQGMLTLYKGGFQGLDQAQDYTALLSSKFAGVKQEMLTAISASCASAPVSGGGTMVKCSSLYSNNVALVGDAGHSMYPALGQGCNSAIESAAVLAQELRNSAGDLQKALSTYSESRLPEVSAAADLSAEVIEIDGSKGIVGTFKKALFGLQILSALILNKLAPAIFSPPFLFQVNKVGASYVQLKQRSRRDGVFLIALMLGVTAALAWVALNVLPSIAHVAMRFVTA